MRISNQQLFEVQESFESLQKGTITQLFQDIAMEITLFCSENGKE